MGKARLAPIKAVTIPHLELTAATVSVRLGEILKKELDETFDIAQNHTDSVAVLRYISNELIESLIEYKRSATFQIQVNGNT